MADESFDTCDSLEESVLNTNLATQNVNIDALIDLYQFGRVERRPSVFCKPFYIQNDCALKIQICRVRAKK